MDILWILVPLSPFLLVAALVLVPAYLRSKERQKMADALRLAIEKGQTLPADIMETMNVTVAKAAPSPQRDLRVGIIWMGVAIGLAFLVLGLINRNRA